MTAVVLMSAVALCTGTLVFALTCFVTGPKPVPAFGLTWSTGFKITSTISSSSSNQTAALLYPGTQRYLWYTAHNPLTVPITVTSMSIATVMSPAGCPTSNLDYSQTTFTGSLVVPPSGTNAVPVPISLIETHTNQDACENTTFNFVYTGTANYTDTTTTKLTSSPNPSASGSSVTFTATVVPTGTPPSNPTGTVDFYQCATASCSSTKPLGSGSLGAHGQARYSTSSLAVGTDFIEAIYQGAPTDFSGSTSNVITQVVTAPIATTTALTSSPNPSGLGKPVTLTATVTKSSGSAAPTGTVSFYSGTPSGTQSPLGTGTLNASAKATFVTSSLPAGTDSLYAVYSGDTNFETSTSPVISQVVVSLPSRCTGNYTNWIFGNPASPNITGTNGNDFIYAFGGSYRVNDFNGDDCCLYACLYAGDGNNVLSDGNGNDVVLAGDGNNVFTLGNGSDSVIVGNGTNTIGAGNGSDSVTVGNGSHNGITLGSGSDSVTLGSGSYNGVTLGSGTDSVTIQGGGYDQINAGAGNETIYLGAATYNTYNGAAHHTNLCHLPAPPSSWHGTVATYYHDTITNCTVVTP
jgi:Ca2+-binding RTX toxin-like protein